MTQQLCPSVATTPHISLVLKDWHQGGKKGNKLVKLKVFWKDVFQHSVIKFPKYLYNCIVTNIVMISVILNYILEETIWYTNNIAQAYIHTPSLPLSLSLSPTESTNTFRKHARKSKSSLGVSTIVFNFDAGFLLSFC